MSKKTSKGVLYIAAGKGYTKMAIASAESVKSYSPKLKVHLFTDQKGIKSEYVDSISVFENGHVRSKLDYIHQTPFDQTLFLDADTRIVSPISEMFQLLGKFDLGMAHAMKRNHFPTTQLWNEAIPNSFPQLNSGVVLFRKNDETLGLFRAWEKAYHANGFWKDQVTLRELIWKSDLKLTILPPEYNIRFQKYIDGWDIKEAEPKILHMAKFKKEFDANDFEVIRKSKTKKQIRQMKWKKIKWFWHQIKSLE